jgi:cation transport ATPase
VPWLAPVMLAMRDLDDYRDAERMRKKDGGVPGGDRNAARGLATPMSIMVGVGRGAQVGVLVKNAEALERLEKATTLVVDKTGTLTEGKPKLVDILPAGGFDAKEFLRFTASLEQNSEHPLAAAIVHGAKEHDIVLDAVKDFRLVTAGGVVGAISGRTVMVGKPDFLRKETGAICGIIGSRPCRPGARSGLLFSRRCWPRRNQSA